MIKPHGTGELRPLFVRDEGKRQTLLEEAETLPQLLLNSAAAANAVMLGAGYFSPLPGYMNAADALCVAQEMHTVDGLFWPVPCLNMCSDVSAIGSSGRI
ncbi:MAG: sulfate adenylyltransferase, partial [Gammaproteobacteria bacterium]|nr:sulfate adenylyltransferase [Gammaproteobacteria bacterium]